MFLCQVVRWLALTLVTELAQEKFDVWTWKAVHGRETQRRVLCDDRAPDLQETDFF
jgi:hypothetical protein